MGGFAGIDQLCPCLGAVLAVLVATFALYFIVATRQVKDCKTLPGRRKQCQKIAAYSFLSAPLAFFLSLLPLSYAWRIPSLQYTPLIGIALMPIFIIYGLINLSRARDVGRLERFYGGQGLKRS